jgi:Trk-type K+ transport system membrane component
VNSGTSAGVAKRLLKREASVGLGSVAVETLDLLRLALMYLIFPLWLLAGFADYFCHRASHIETTSGLKESLLHVAGFGEVAFPVFAALFLQVNILILAVMFIGVVLHEAMIIWDVSYAASTRHISPLEQHVHALLELLPWVGFLLIAILHWDAVSEATQARNFVIAWKQPPLDTDYLIAIVLAVFLFGIGPYAEEFIRCYRNRSGCASPDVPAE